MGEMIHEPETKGTNKTRDLQDAVIRARRAGYGDSLAVARSIHDWFMESSYEIQVSVLQYAVTHLWTTVSSKMDYSSPARVPTVSTENKKRIQEKTRSELDRKWIDVILPMTGAQVRAAQMLPPEMTKKIADDQRVGDVFTVKELREVQPK